MNLVEIGPMRLVAEGLLFPEGPVALSDGSVIAVEIAGGSVARVWEDRSITRIHCGGGPNGSAIGPDGALYVCNDGGLKFDIRQGLHIPTSLAENNEGGAVQRVDLETGAVQTIATHVEGARIGSLNDIVFDAVGGCYIVDTSWGAIHYLDVRTRHMVAVVDGLQFPNGMGLSPDGERLYVSETYSGKIVRFDVVGAGIATNKCEHYRSPIDQSWDGLCVDAEENICVANTSGSGISVIDRRGNLIAVATTPTYDSFVTNICFGGDDYRTAYICSSSRGALYAVEWPWAGLKLNYGR